MRAEDPLQPRRRLPVEAAPVRAVLLRPLAGLAAGLALALWVWLLGSAGRPARAAPPVSAPPVPPTAAPAPVEAPAGGSRPARGALPPGPGRALERAARWLRERPELAPLEPDRHPPLFEGFRRRGATVEVVYRQELEMQYGTLVALYRGLVSVPTDAGPDHRRLTGPPAGEWIPLPPRSARELWRRSGR